MAIKLKITREWLQRKLDKAGDIDEPSVIGGGFIPFPPEFEKYTTLPKDPEPVTKGDSFPKPRRRSQ